MLKDVFRERSTQALRNKDAETRRIMNAIHSKFLEVEKSEGFAGWSERLELDTIRSYIKSLQKALEQLKSGPVHEQYVREITMLNEYLPKTLDEAGTRALLEPLVGQVKSIGQLMGLVMKEHRDQVDAVLVRKVAADLGLK